MLEIHANLLWIGNAGALQDPAALFDRGVSAIIDVAYEEPPAMLPRQLIYCRFPIKDGGDNEPVVLQQAVQTLVDLLRANIRTLVACSAGMSRSPSIAAHGLAAHLGGTPEIVLSRISQLRPLEINSRLWDDLAAVLPKIREGRS